MPVDHALRAFVVHDLRWDPLDPVFRDLSAWWVRSLVLVAIACIADVVARRRVPVAGIYVALAYVVASELTTVLKLLVGRPRPHADHLVTAYGSSFPSGHAATSFAASVAIGVLHRRLLAPLVVLAGLIGFSRVYLGVHYPLDVVAGALLGTAVALAFAPIARRAAVRAASARVTPPERSRARAPDPPRG